MRRLGISLEPLGLPLLWLLLVLRGRRQPRVGLSDFSVRMPMTKRTKAKMRKNQAAQLKPKAAAPISAGRLLARKISRALTKVALL